VRLDALYLSLALRNLIDNAIKYGGTGSIVIRTHREASRAGVTVHDQGPGIPAEERQRIFEPFYRGKSPLSSKHSGFGLGLSFARDIARAHEGDVVLQSGGVGTTFCLTLPLDESHPARSDHGSAAHHR
jgi:signal transduction histidine kinase